MTSEVSFSHCTLTKSSDGGYCLEPVSVRIAVHYGPISIPRVTKITSSCTKSFEGAIQVGISRANETLENVKGAWIQEQKVVVEKGKITEYRVNMKVTLKSFKLHPEINNYGFYVQRGGELGNLTDAEEGFVPGHNTTVEPQSYSWTDKSPARYYRLRQVDMDGIWHLSEILVNPQTDIESATADPVAFALDQNYPNPSTRARPFALNCRAGLT